MDKGISYVHEFHTAYGIPTEITPTIPTKDRVQLREELIAEEFKELVSAMYCGDLIDVFDALLDLQYVIDGTFLEFGLQNYKEAGLKEVHRSNMSKLGEDGKPIYRADGKVLKGPNYFAPYLRAVLNGEIA